MTEIVRSKRRFRISLPLWIRMRQEPGSKSAVEESIADEETMIENISSKGCFFLLSRRPSIGLNTEMFIRLPDKYCGGRQINVHCRGRVVRVMDRMDRGKVGVACTIWSCPQK
jgi:hypothetical protein